jgi:aspartyl aminopeptidase
MNYDCVWDKLNSHQQELTRNFSKEYTEFLNSAKTERLAVEKLLELSRAEGFKSLEEYTELKAGDKVYYAFRNKTVCCAIIGEQPLEKGAKIIGSHLDAPRLDLKQNPVYEDTGLAMFKTHYYGGIKKYQWSAIPLALHGVVVTADGQTRKISIGEEASDPVFTITDLLPHLAKDQMEKNVREVITGEGLNILVASTPCTDSEVKDRVKQHLLEILATRYCIKEEDFVSAELEAVPAGSAREVGFDRGIIGGYGQDDRVCVYTSLRALFAIRKPVKTCIALFVDKEETGSDGATGMKSDLLEDFLAELNQVTTGKYDGLALRRALKNSEALSADVTSAFDPNYPEVNDKYNSAYLGKGIVITKYSGIRGKYDTSDANAEFVGKVRYTFKQAGIVWQSAEMGKVDQGGGGTIAQYLARYGMEVLDCGPAVLSIHAPFELIGIGDIYMSYLAYLSFFNS